MNEVNKETSQEMIEPIQYKPELTLISLLSANHAMCSQM